MYSLLFSYMARYEGHSCDVSLAILMLLVCMQRGEEVEDRGNYVDCLQKVSGVDRIP